MDAISCLAPLLATSFADAAIARALHFSSSSVATTTTIISPDSSSASSHHNDLPPVPVPVPPHAASFHPVRQNHHQQALAPRGARAGKRRSRAPTTTYISTDTANFRLMVQQITGAQEADGGDVAGVDVTVLQVQAAALLGAAGAGSPQLLPGDDEASALRRHQLHPLDLQQQPCFPTLDSWNVMYEYETNSSGAGML